MSDAAPAATTAGKSNRVRMGLTIAAIVLALVYLGGWFWAAFVAFFLYFGFKELCHILEAIHIRPSRLIVLPVGFVMILVATLNQAEFLSPLLTLALIASFFRLIFRHPRATVGDIGGTLIALVYVAYMPVHYILLRQLDAGNLPWYEQPGAGYLFLVIFVVGLSDVGAYYVGKAFGKHLLSPEISPKKTTEGAIGGLVIALLGALAVSWVIHFPLHHGLILGLILTVVGQLGDLTESLIKRDAGVKDSGAVLKGHGGLLDRADSYIFSGVACYYYIHWIVLKHGLAQDVLNLF